MLDAGMPGWMVDAMMELHAIDKAGYAAAVAPDLVEVLGRPAQTFEEFAKLHADRWRA
jgi:cytochrome c2